MLDKEPDADREDGAQENAKDSGHGGSAWLETLRTIVIAVLIAVGVRTFGVPVVSGRILASEPERGDVAVFTYPRDDKTDYIKRIVGLPGDKIEVREGVLHINDAPVQRELLSASEAAELDYGQSGFLYYETLPNGRRHLIREVNDEQRYDNFPPVVVPDGHYFAMGDNRDNSLDSRADVGFVPFENLVGRADVLFFSHDGSSPWWQFWTWPSTIRFGRIGDGIE